MKINQKKTLISFLSKLEVILKLRCKKQKREQSSILLCMKNLS